METTNLFYLFTTASGNKRCLEKNIAETWSQMELWSGDANLREMNVVETGRYFFLHMSKFRG